MNQQLFETGYAAYQSGDWAGAANALAGAKDEGEQVGRVDHLRGNALMQMGRYAEAADAYGEALEDSAYGMVGALSCNRGRALVAAGRLSEAVDALNGATKDESYPTPYKAYMALGSACRALGDVRGAGIAYRNAAIDEANPDPSAALRKLGGCFMDLGRPTDAVESYRTALDFSTDTRVHNAVYCDLALAYVAANRMHEAVDAFEHATADGSYVLTPEANASYEAARNAVMARSGERRTSDTDDFLAAAGYGAYPPDPLDPTGQTSGNLMPSPEDTGFFSISEEEIMGDEMRRRKGRGGKVLLVLVLILVVLGVAAGFGYYSGFGWPMQETVVQDLFAAQTNGDALDTYLAPSLDDEARARIETQIPKGAVFSVNGVDRAMSSSKVRGIAALAEGGERSYTITLVRSGIGWKVSGVEPAFASAEAAEVAEEAPAAYSPTEEAPLEEAPAEEAPAEEAPAEEAPVEEAPAEEAPVEEAPVEGDGAVEGL